jgi:hexosaminidase
MSSAIEEIKTVSIIPKPIFLNINPGTFQFNENLSFFIDLKDNSAHFMKIKGICEYFKEIIDRSTGFNMNIKNLPEEKGNKDIILLKINPELETLGQEGYTLEITKTLIIISSISPTGLFYGLQSVRQLLPVDIESPSKLVNVEWNVPCLEIKDSPRFAWRGFMLDEGRHFQGMETVKKFLDMMALFKMNIFHWHLTEDQGWRIEIKKYPKLTEIGSIRNKTAIGGIFYSKLKKLYDNTPHSGFYTQDEIREIVEYAAKRNILVVPEIEMPGHCMAALASYPGFSCTGGPFEIPGIAGIYKDVFCVGKEEVINFIHGVLDEVMEMFPSEVIHIGGDEAPKERWKNCPDCQKRMKSEELNDEHDLQVNFTNQIGAYLSLNERRLMGWNEILGEALEKNAIAQFWMGNKKKLLYHIRNGRQVVISNYFNTYLDYHYNMIPLRNYYFNPIPKNLEEKYHQNIIGVETPLWTEGVPNRKRAEWQAFPRLLAIAESGWLPEEFKNYESFWDRLKVQIRRLDILGVNHADLEIVDPGAFKRIIGLPKIFGNSDSNI